MVASEISKLAINNEGEVTQKKIDVNARKIPFKDIRKEALTRNKSYLKIKDDSYYTQLNREEIKSELQKIHEEVSDDVDEMRSCLKNISAKGTGSSGMTTPQLWSHAFLCLRTL